jgi:ABC-type maltose transport system permease subunit
MIYMPNHPTAAYGLWRMNSQVSSYTDYIIFKVAGFMILILPTFVLFMLFKDKMIGNLTIGGLKG